MARMMPLVRRFVYWSKIDQDIQNIVRLCRWCSLSAKFLTVIYQSWPNAVKYLRLDCIVITLDMWMVVMSWLSSSFSKWFEIFKSISITSTVNVKFFHELVSRYGFPGNIMSDNGTWYTLSKFQIFLPVLCSWTCGNEAISPNHAENFINT